MTDSALPPGSAKSLRLPVYGRREQVVHAAGLFVLGLSAVVLLGWALRVRLMQTFFLGGVTIKANTAFALLLAAAALLLHGAPSLPLRGRVALARGLGGIVAALGAATLAQYVLGVDLRVDEMLFTEGPDALWSATPGRMAAVSAFAFILIGSALALVGIETRRGRRPAQPLAVSAGALALAALLGYLYGAIPTSGTGHGIQIAIPTAIGIVLLASGTLALEARFGWLQTLLSPSAGGHLARRLLPLAFFVPLALGALRHMASWAGVADTLDDHAAVAVLTMLAFGVVIWRTAQALNAAEQQWQATEYERLRLVTQEEASRERAIMERVAREAAEEAVREKDEALTLLDLVLDSTPVGFALLDRDLRFRRINAAFAGMCGVPLGAHGGRPLADVLSGAFAELVADVRRVLATGEPIINAVRVTGEREGRRQHWLSSKYPVRSREGEVIGVGLTLIETTERMELEGQLQQSQKMEAIGQLAGGVAHDFNNLLTVITAYADLLLADVDEQDARRLDLIEIQSAARRAAGLTGQLLAFSRKQVLQPRVLDLNAVAAGVEKMLRRLISADIEVVLALTPGVRPVLADPGQIEQVLMNLAVNARDAMPNGGRITIETANVSLSPEFAGRRVGVKPGEYVMLAVSDTGTGIPAEILDHIFEPFFTTKEAGKGTGLGLSTVHGIVKQSGGDLWVYSEPGQGTTFKIYLPPATGERRPVRTPPGGVSALRGTETILLVEDDEAVRTLAARVLEQRGYTVLIARDGGDALRIVEEHVGDVHMVATDVVMPGMSGRNLTEQLAGRRPGITVLYMSGYTDDEVMRRGIVDQHTAFLQKPFTADDLARKVRDVLDEARDEHPTASERA